MADVTNISPFAVGERVLYYVSYFDGPPKWYDVGATVVAINSPTNDTNETFDISYTFTVPPHLVSKDGHCCQTNGVRPYRERPLQVGQICEHVLARDEDGDVTATMPYIITSIRNDGTLELTFLQRGMQAAHLYNVSPDINPFAGLIMLINQLSAICVICISVIMCTDNVISHDETGDGPKSIFAIITPSGCNPLVGKRLYGNDSSMMWSDQGWQFFQRVGMCPVAGIDSIDSYATGAGTVQGANKVTTINYRGCMDFRYSELWQNLDNMNALAGVTTHLATAATSQLTTFKALNNACCAMVWLGTAVGILAVSPHAFSSGRGQGLCITGTWVSMMTAAFVCALLSFRLVTNSDLLQPSSYQNSLFQSCQVSIVPYKAKNNVDSSYTTHLVLVYWLGILLGLGILAILWFLNQGEEYAKRFLYPNSNPTTVHPHRVVTEDSMMALAIMPLPVSTPTTINEGEKAGTGTGVGEGIELGDIEAHEVVDDDAMLPSGDDDTFTKPRHL